MNGLKSAICTISTQSHVFKVKALRDSLVDLTDADFHCLVTDGLRMTSQGDPITYHHLDDLSNESTGRIRARYSGNRLRWAHKPYFLDHLIQLGYDRVIYVDNDIMFYSSPDFLFELLDSYRVLLTPHSYPSDPKSEQHWLEAYFRVGLYNAGFIGVNREAREALRWWGECCAYNIKKSAWRGLFDDQRYLDLMPVLFDRIHVLRHAGCNVAGWNVQTCPRSVGHDGSIRISGDWPLVFVHFSTFTIRAILRGQDPLLTPLLHKYEVSLRKWNPSYSSEEEASFSLRDAYLAARHVCWRLVRITESV